MKRLLGVVLLATVVVVGLSCGNDPTVSGPGTLLVRLTSPHSGADSAIVLTITGPAALTSAVPGPGLRLFQQPQAGPPTRFALIGQLNNGAIILTIGIKDLGEQSQYNGTINGVAQPNYQLRPLQGYALALPG